MNARLLLTFTFALSSFYVPSVVSQEGTLEEIVVTARKKAESLQDVPVVVTALNSEMIETYNVTTIEDVATLTPGFHVGAGSLVSGSVIFLRGIGTASINTLADQAVSFAIDGFSIGHGALSRVSQLDIAQVEVLKGPQALFFGKNSPGGVVSYTSNNPTDEFELELGAGYEMESDDMFYQGVVSGPLSDTLGARLAVRVNDNEGWLRNTAVVDPNFPGPPGVWFSTGAATDHAFQGEELFVRGTVQWEPTDRFSMLTKVAHNKNELDFGSFSTSQRVVCPGPGGIGRNTATGDDCDLDFNAPSHQAPQPHRDALPAFGGATNDFTDTEMWVVTNEINFDVSDYWTLTAVTGYFDSDDLYAGTIDVGPFYVWRTATQSAVQEHFTQEIRLASNLDGPLNFTVGGLWGDAEQTSEIGVAVASSVIALGPTDQPKTIDTDTLSAFAQADFTINDQWSLTAGARWTEEKKEFSAQEGGDPITNLTKTKDTYRDFSPEATVSWFPNDNVMLYAAYKEGFKSGGFNATFLRAGGFNLWRDVLAPGVLFDISYDPETAKGFEIGAKTELLDNSLRLNVAVFDYEYTDLQLGRFNPEVNALIVVNAAELQTRGLEFDFLYSPEAIPGLTLRGALAYLDSEFSNFANAPCYEGQSLEEGCNLDFDVLLNRFVSQDLSGEAAPYSTEWSHTWGFTYERPAMDGWTWSVSADATYSDDYYVEQSKTPDADQNSYWTYGAALALTSDDGAWGLTLAGRNLSNEVVLTNAFTATGTGSGTGEPIANAVRADMNGRVARKRQVWLQLKYRFQ